MERESYCLADFLYLNWILIIKRLIEICITGLMIVTLKVSLKSVIFRNVETLKMFELAIFVPLPNLTTFQYYSKIYHNKTEKLS